MTERIQKFSDPPLTICPHCGGELEQLISAPAVQFKGAGWYVTDYAKSGGKAGGDDGKKTDGAGSESGSSGDKPTSSDAGSSTSSPSSSGSTETASSKAAAKSDTAKT